MNLFDDDILENRDDDDLMAMAMSVRVRTLTQAVNSERGIDNTMDNRMLLNDISNGAAQRIKLKQNDKALDSQSQNAALVQNVLERLTGVNPFVGSEGVGMVVDASFEETFPDKIDPDTITLGNQRLSLEDAGIDEQLL